MYVHVGGDFMIRSRDLIGIFNIEQTTVSNDTREYLKSASYRGCEISCTDELPRSFVVTFNTENLDEKVYISRVSAATLEQRVNARELSL